MPAEQVERRNHILSLVIEDRSALHAAYMPFVKNGGLFVPTSTPYRLGDELFLLVQLLDQPERIPVAGKVIWMTPQGAEGNRVAGVGIQFNAQGNQDIRQIFEQYLSAGTEPQGPTHTL
ncbi:MAG: PilZ domain-containing protein [Halochromatium sp.]|uniref:PilZ domain-containing protein n=1 Tax=Halochromatium sp. TaxID=2049430 RepID=UPI00397C1146